jgi:hypothetical protein
MHHSYLKYYQSPNKTTETLLVSYAQIEKILRLAIVPPITQHLYSANMIKSL